MIFGNSAKGGNKKSDSIKKKNSELLDDDFFNVDNGLSKIEISGLGIKQSRDVLSSSDKKSLSNADADEKDTGEQSIITSNDTKEKNGSQKSDGPFFVLKSNKRSGKKNESNQTHTHLDSKKHTVFFDYGLDGANGTEANEASQRTFSEYEKRKSPAPGVTDINSADAVFTSDFDPFKLAMSEELAHKPSSRSKAEERPKVSERLTEITEEDVERARLLAEEELERKRKQEKFARKKAEYFASIRSSQTAVKPDGSESGTADSLCLTDDKTRITHIALEDTGIPENNSENVKNSANIEFGSDKIPHVQQNIESDIEEPFDSQKRESYSFNPYLNTKTGMDSRTNTEWKKPTDGSSYRRAAEFAKAALSGGAASKENPQERNAPAQSCGDLPAYSNPTNSNSGSSPEYSAELHGDNGPSAAYSGSKSDEADFDTAYTDAVCVCEHSSQTESEKNHELNIEFPGIFTEPNYVFNSIEPEETHKEYEYGEYRAAFADEPDGLSNSIATEGQCTENSAEQDFNFADTSESDDGNVNESGNSHGPVFKEFPSMDPDGEPESGLVFEINENIPANPTRVQPMTIVTERTMLGFRPDNDDPSEQAENEHTDFSENVDEYTEEDELNYDELSENNDSSDAEGWNEKEISPENQNPDVIRMRSSFSILNEDSGSEVEGGSDESGESSDSDKKRPDEPDDGGDNAPINDSAKRSSPKASKERNQTSEKKKTDYSYYQPPPIELLGLDEEIDDNEIAAEIQENTKTIIETLASFHVTASIKGVDRGPRITRYEVVPAKGVKVNQITNLFDDITLYLAADGVRMEAPIPGKSAIGFEIPNKRKANVRLRELLECDEFINSKSNTFVCIGKDVAGNPIFGDIGKFPHALIAGATGMGKSVAINAIMISILYKARPDQVKFIMIDPKKVEFKMYSGIPHLLVPVITEAKQAAGALMWAVEEMERRFEVIEKLNIRTIEAYNERQLKDSSIGEYMPRIIVVIDELNDLMMQVRDPVEDLIMRIAQKARAAGIHLIIGTQRPDVKVITGTIKANINTRISCKVTSVVDSRTILEMAGAEKLLPHGDMLFKPVDKTKPVRVQGAFVSDSEVENIMDFLKNQIPDSQYDEEIFTEINKAAQKCGNKKGGGQNFDDESGDDSSACGYYSDQQFLDAVELAIRLRKVATSLLQRKMSIGYSKAAKFIDCMEEIGVVGPPNGSKPREVLITIDEWYEKLSRVNDD